MEREVRVRSGRYRLTSQRLRLSRGPRGVVVEGDGRLAGCPCLDPPVTLGFSSVTLAPPTDLLVEDPTVRLGGVPVLWLPWLWLRSPDRAGLLPPTVRYNSEEGIGVGTGVHVPYGVPRSDAPRDALALGATGFGARGFGLDALHTTRGSTLRLGWERLRGDRVVVDGAGASHAPGGLVVALRADVARGDRARRGALRLEPAARRYDRVDAVLGAAGGAALVGGVRARLDAPRGAPWDAPVAYGPGASVGVGWALGRSSAAHAGLEIGSASDGVAATSLSQQHGRLGTAAHLGPLRLRAEAVESVGVAASADAAELVGLGRAGLELASPLERRFGREEDGLAHRVTPALGFVAAVERAGSIRTGGAGDRRAGALLGGLATSLGSPGGSAIALDLRGGALTIDAEPPVGLVTGELGADLELFGAAVRAVTAPEAPRGDVALSARLGSPGGLHLLLRAAGTDGGGAASDVALLHADRARAAPAWLDEAGWAAGSTVIVPWSRALSTLAEVDADVTGRRWLAARIGAGYRHRCGCFSVGAEAGSRVGRQGLDVLGTVDLLP